MKRMREAIDIIRINIWTLVKYEAVYKILTLFIFIPLFLKGFNGIMNITGYTYLTADNLSEFLFKPITLLFLFILVILMTLYNMFDITTIIIILDASYQKKTINTFEALYASLSKWKNLFKLENILLPFFVLLLIPLVNIGISSDFISSINIPAFVMEVIEGNRIYYIAYWLMMIIFVVILILWMYSLHYFVLENENYFLAIKHSMMLGKHKHISDILILALIQVCLIGLYLLFVGIGVLVIYAMNAFINNVIFKSIVSTLVFGIGALSFVIFTVLSTPMNYSAISVLYYARKEEKGEECQHIELKHIKLYENLYKKFKKMIIYLSAIATVLGVFFAYNVYKGNFNLNIEYIRTMEVSAHRGASAYYPENTMSAFQGAVELGADWIELDVQQTKDGVIIVSHDTNFKRILGLNKNVWEMTYDDIKDLDAGSFFNSEYSYERIPLLEDVVAFAKENNIRLNIELKPTGHETDFEKNVIDIVNAYDFQDYCVITSQTYSALKNVKEYDENIKTVYVMAVAYGRITNLEYADNFSVEASNVSKSLVKQIHNANKEIYVWTVNSESTITKMIDYNVDNIITDDITLAKDTIMESKTSNMINEYVEFIESIF
ncbi:MAG: glycerophosphoryl diester phosphodiesterase membrane domain-containing protein [Erysipelotrichaceae bacterium]|nr:glycerophosphoryl diester phosphodiesterase membrane domain-containing protein [Erysipelotrichaceae bacterium]